MCLKLMLTVCVLNESPYVCCIEDGTHFVPVCLSNQKQSAVKVGILGCFSIE